MTGAAPSLLVAIPHFYDGQGSGRHGSTSKDPSPRIAALRQAILGLHINLAGAAAVLDIAERQATPGPQPGRVEIVVVTTAGKHILSQLGLPQQLYHHQEVALNDPRLLGFACQQILAQNTNGFDWLAFMEDDLVVQDPLFLKKIAWFHDVAGPQAVLQPNRVEWSLQGSVRRLYIDGPLKPSVVEPFMRRDGPDLIKAHFLGSSVAFIRARNPHAGCFFLTREQMRHWADTPYFCDQDASFISPLESSASLGLMKTFNVYKTDAAHSDLLQIEHAGRGFIQMVGNQIPLSPPLTA